jgi:hypothetical protein
MENNALALEKFVDQMIEEKFGESPLGDEVRAQIKKELADRLNQYITLRTIEHISLSSPDAIPQLETLIKSNPTAEQVNTFINERVDQPDVLVAQILSDFRGLYIGDETKTH